MGSTKIKHLIQKLKLIFVLLVLGASGCSVDAGDEQAMSESSLRVVATSNILGDIVSNIGGGAIDLFVLFPAGVDPHSYEPSPRDLGNLVRSAVIFENGIGFEATLDSMLRNVPDDTEIVSVSSGVRLLDTEGNMINAAEMANISESEIDPHVWFDPNNVLIWVDNIEKTLARKDPQNQEIFAENADAYRTELRDLDVWIREKVATLPVQTRLLVTDHDTLAYLAHQYDFRIVGTIVQGGSTVSEPSAKELAMLAEAIESSAAQAIFTGPEVNMDLAEQLAEETGTTLIEIYSGSLGDPESEVNNYLSYMRFNVNAIVDNLAR